MKLPMFNWICEKCGRECQPNESECPACNPKDAPAAVVHTGPVEPPAFGAVMTGATAEKPRSATAKIEKKSGGIPGWLVAILSFVAIAAIGGGAFYGLRYWQNRPTVPAAAAPTTATAPHGNPLLKQLEVTGLRLTEDSAKKVFLTFALVNHSPDALDNLKGKLTLHTKDAPVGTMEFSVASIAANRSQDVTGPLSTTLRVYELPDWQFLRAEIELVP